MSTPKALFNSLFLATLLLSACNGGVSDLSINQNGLLNGQYQVHQVGTGMHTARVDVSVDGLGGGTWNITSRSSGGTGNGLLDYAVTSNRMLSVTTKDAAGTTTIGTDYGIVSTDGRLFVIADTNPVVSAVSPVEDTEIIIAAGIKKSVGLSNAILNGSYQIHQTGDAGTGLGLYTARIDIHADGMGAGTWTIASHSGGNANNGIFSYAIAFDGTLDITVKDITGTATLGTEHGIISANGDYFVITDTNPVASATQPVEDAEIILAAGVKKSSGLADTALSGSYQIYQVGKNGASVLYTARTDIIANGMGGGTWNIVSHSSGSNGSGILNYSVNLDGTFSASTAAGTSYGVISADGNLFVMTDTTFISPGDTDIAFAIGIRN